MPRLSEAKKDVTSCEKSRLGANIRRIADVRMGQPAGGDSGIRHNGGGEPGELKHLSTRRKRKQTSDCASSGERTRNSPNRRRGNASCGVVGPSTNEQSEVSGTVWKVGPQRVKAPYAKTAGHRRRHLSSAGHEKSCMNPRGPSRKAKYSRETDSEPVL